MYRLATALVLAVFATGCTGTATRTGAWRSTSLTGGIEGEITAMYLDLKEDGTFTAQFEGPDARAPENGTYAIAGDTLTLKNPQFEVWSFRFVDGRLRANTGGSGVVVVQQPTGG